MIKCPKCSFEQPEDIYCASCGVNMKTYRPSAAPFFKAFISSWIGKIAIITLMIIGALIYDWQKTKDHPASGPRSQQARSNVGPTSQEYEVTQDAAPAQPTPTEINRAATGSLPSTKKIAPHATNLGAATKVESPAAAVTNTQPVLRVTFYHSTRSGIQELQKESLAAALSGDVSGGTFPQRKLSSLSSDLKSLASSRYKITDTQKPIIIYKGQRTNDVKMGLYFQITPLRQEGSSLQLEVKSWGNIKQQDNDETFFTAEITINPQQAAFISGFLPRDKTFSDEEKTVIDGDPTLKIYNQEDFIEGSADLIMVIEMT